MNNTKNKITYEDFQSRGYYAVEYQRLSQWQRLRGIVINCGILEL